MRGESLVAGSGGDRRSRGRRGARPVPPARRATVVSATRGCSFAEPTGEFAAQPGTIGRSARRFVRGHIPVSANPRACMFDVLETAGTELLARPYRERRAILEDLFARDTLAAPLTLCPASSDRATALDWLDPAWGTASIEGVVVKGTGQSYQAGKRGWVKVRNMMNPAYPYAARHRFARSLPVPPDGRGKGKGKESSLLATLKL
ncbi:hypothetical protein [Streptomyces sp. NPDC050564]|uniref:ATP-dependent DNA ligase n=1 Tax=Streptomyces sp. NPDC050564 TaxID=3365631 RepID=UPI00379ECCE1